MSRNAKVQEPLTDPLKMRNYLEFVLRDARPGPTRGRIIKRGKGFNTVSFGGRGWALERICTTATGKMLSAIALGSNSATGPAASQTSLVSYMTIRTFNGGTTLSTSTSAACTFSGAISFASNETWTNSGSIGEFAIYNSASSGATSDGIFMFNRITTATYISFASTNTLAITISITN